MAGDTKTIVVEPTRKEAIAKALDEAENLSEAKVEDKVKDKVEDKKVEDKKVEEPDEDALLAKQGKELLLALKDPTKAGAIIKFLAEQAGYTKAPVTKVEVKEVKDDILEDLKESLGDEFSIVAERLAPAIEKILSKKLEKSQADIRAKFQEQEQEKVRNQSSSALTKLSDEFFGVGEELPSNVQEEMSKFMDRVQPSPDSSVKEYVQDAFNSAIGKLGLSKSDKVKNARSERNRIDVSSRLASERAPGVIVQDDSKPMTRQEAIRKAIEAANKE